MMHNTINTRVGEGEKEGEWGPETLKKTLRSFLKALSRKTACTVQYKQVRTVVTSIGVGEVLVEKTKGEVTQGLLYLR